MNDVSAVSPSSACSPATMGCQLPQPTPPPAGSVMRTTVSRIWWTRRAVSGVEQSAMRSPSTCRRAPPFAVVVAVEAEVEPGAEMEAGVGDDLDLERAGRAVGHRAVDAAAAQPPVHGSYASSGTMSTMCSTRPSGCSTPQHLLWSRPGPAEVVEVHEDPVAASRRAVRGSIGVQKKW